MARLIKTPTSGGLVGEFEPKVLDALLKQLPSTYSVAANFQLKQKGHDALEYDFIVLAPHAVYVVEAKEWYGELTGDDTEWVRRNVNIRPIKCPMWLVNTKAKILRSELGPVGQDLYVAAAMVIPDGTKNFLGGSWGNYVRSLSGLAGWLQDPSRLPADKVKPGTNILGYHGAIESALQGRWGARQREQLRRIGSYEITETLDRDLRGSEFLARRALIEGDLTRYRIRTWRLDPGLPKDAQERQKAVIRRPTEAVSKIGEHPNLLRVLQFDFVDEDQLFFEVTEWSEFGMLHGFLARQERGRLTIRERLDIAEGVAAALEAVHARGVVHRNVCPETILIGFDRRPRLTDFDRAYVDSKYSVFLETEDRRGNLAYVPPELADATDYDFDTASDMYSFGVLLYQLLAERVPFRDPQEAKARRGVPPPVADESREDISKPILELILGLLRVDDFKARPSATEALAVIRKAHAESTARGAALSPAPAASAPPTFEPGALLDGVWRVDEKLGTGAISRAFKVFNLDHQRAYTMKVLHQVENAGVAIDEFRTLQGILPSHPHLARLHWMARLAPPDSTPYVLYEYIEGEPLEPYCNGSKRLAWRDIKSIGLKLLDALGALHGAGIVHRDVKPANILLELPTHEPKLIDFNIARRVESATGVGGTPRYWAPDRHESPGFPVDLFSLGVVLYELVLQRHPFPHDKPEDGPPYDPRDTAIYFRVSDRLADFLLKAVQPKAADRFASAVEMRAALERVDTMFAPAEPPPVAPGQFPGLSVSPEEASRPNYNPYVTRLLTLYSQARKSNAGTRGLDEIARLTYVKTRLDDELTPAIAGGRFRLVIVTGNAGDGKTAFLQQVEHHFAGCHAEVNHLPSGNGSRWEFDGLRYETNYDGSQDEGDRANDDVLAHFFLPFAGPTLAGLDGPEVRLIAINEGRLLDFLAHGTKAAQFAGLRKFVHDALAGAATPSAALLVNLNLRAVTAGGNKSLVERQLKAMLQPQIWAPCQGCGLRDRCPIKHNADSLEDVASGTATRERLRRLFELVHLRRRAHVTMRDLRSALAYMMLRDQGCDDIARLLARSDGRVTEDLARLYYPNAFADADAEIGRSAQVADNQRAAAGDERAVDRLVRRLREADVGLVNSPALDRRLDYAPETAVPWMTYERRSPEGWKVVQALQRNAPSPGGGTPLPGLFDARRRLLANWRRWAYFERRDEGWRDMLPYRSTRLLERIVLRRDDEDFAEACEELRNNVIDAISFSEGVQDARLRSRYLALKITRVKEGKIKSYRLFPKESFRVEVAATPPAARFLEYAPDAVELVAEGGSGVARLRISLDLLEMLELIRNGYRPTTTELQGLFVNLLIFRNELLTTTFDRVLITADDREFFEVTAEGRSDGIRLNLERHAHPGEPRSEGGAQ